MIITGIISLLVTFFIIRYAKKSRLPREEWIALCSILCVCAVIIVATNPSFLYIAIICVIILFSASFIFNHKKFDQLKNEFNEKENSSDNCRIVHVVGEISTSSWKQETDISMHFELNHIGIGTAVPYKAYGYEFAFWNTVGECCSLIKTNSRYAFPSIYPLCSYELVKGEQKLLSIKNLNRKKIIAETPSGDTCTIQLYKRKLTIASTRGYQAEIHLLYEGILIECDEHHVETNACLSYFLWLIIFGSRRQRGN